MSEEMEKLGTVPGIWFRPLLTMEYFPENCLLHKQGPVYTLDPSQPEVLSAVTRDVKNLIAWGYKLIKYDFSLADSCGEMYGDNLERYFTGNGWSFRDRSRTTAEILKNFYRTVYEAAGEKAVLIGCNVLGHLGTGYFQINRTGDDTSGRDWNVTRRNGPNTLAFRYMQDGIFYGSDADCVGITSLIPWEKNRLWLRLIAASHTPLFVSIAQDAFGPEQQRDITEAFREAREGTGLLEPLDWLSSLTPRQWRTEDGRILTFDW